MVKRLIDRLLVRYDSAEPMIRLKARFLMHICITLLVIIPVLISYSAFLQMHNPLFGYSLRWHVIVPEMLTVLMVFCILILSIRGHFTAAAHSLFTVLSSAFWCVMFADRSVAINRLDTVVIALAVFSLTPLLILRKKWIVFLYCAANIVMLFIFMQYNKGELSLPVNTFWDYLADTSIAFIFIAIVSYNIMAINNEALDVAAQLSSGLMRNNEELEATNEELEATNEELQATMEELEATNEQLMESNRDLEEARQRISESEQNYRRLSSFNERLNEIFIFFTEAESLGQLYERIAGSLRLLTGAVAATVSKYDVSSKRLEVVSVAAEETLVKNLGEIAGEPIISMSGSVPGEAVPNMLSQIVYHANDLSDITFGKISSEISKAILERMGCREVVRLSLHYGSELLGNTTAYLGEESYRVPDNALKSFAYMAGLAITRKRSEEALASSLHEKEILLKEVHHRVKNNLQIIISLLNMQAMRLGDEKLTGLFADSNNRIRSMSRIHEKLYGAQDLAGINFADYLREMARDICSVQLRDGRRIRIEYDTERIVLGVKEAIPCGLILNEVLTNAFKHAFPEGFSGDPQLHALLRRREGDVVEMAVRDNGIGIDESLLSGDNGSMGLFLIRILVRQLDGTLELFREGGTCYRIFFPLITTKL